MSLAGISCICSEVQHIWYPESWKKKQREGKTKLLLLASIEPYMGSTSSWKLPSVWFFYCEAQPNSFALPPTITFLIKNIW